MAHSFQPLLFGGDINVYSVARAFHEGYGVKSIAYGKHYTFPCAYSQIIDYRICDRNDEPEVFLEHVASVCAQHPDKTVLVIGCGDNYVALCAHLQDRMPKNALAPYISGALLDELVDKERFYALCDRHAVPHPATFVYHKEMVHDFTLPFDGPFIAKPADSVAYWQHAFVGIKKVYLCQTRQELEGALDAVYGGGYPGAMIVQEFIPGDDTYMRVMTSYSDRNGRVKLMCLGHVLLEEHSPYGVGNHAVILTEHDQALSQQLQGLLDELGYTGFSNFDVKYDQRDGIYKVFECNCRQGRSNYYVTGAGYNIATLLVRDRVEGEALPLTIAQQPSLWRMVPRKVAFDFIPKAYHPRMKELIRAGRDSHSMEYQGDMALGRRWRLWKNHVGNRVRFNRHNKRPQE